MATPIIEDIIADVLTTLATVTTGNGYEQTITPRRPAPADYENDDPWDDLTCLVAVDSISLNGDQQTKLTRRVLTLLVVVITRDSDSSETAEDIRKAQIAADIEKALRVDVTRDGNAERTWVGDIDFFADLNGEEGGVALEVKIQYRYALGNPYSL